MGADERGFFMHARMLDATPLAGEYEALVEESKGRSDDDIDWTILCRQLVENSEWTDAAATHLIALARSYGSFMLRNALALAVALDIEDGEAGF